MLYAISFLFCFFLKRVKVIALDVIETIRMSHISDLLADSQIEYRLVFMAVNHAGFTAINPKWFMALGCGGMIAETNAKSKR